MRPMIMAMDDASVPPKYASPPPNYTYRAEWDPERSEYIARCLEFPGRSATAFTAHDAVAAMEKVVCRATCLAEPMGRCKAGRPPADRQYR